MSAPYQLLTAEEQAFLDARAHRGRELDAAKRHWTSPLHENRPWTPGMERYWRHLQVALDMADAARLPVDPSIKHRRARGAYEFAARRGE